MTARKVSSDPIYLVELSILIVASENRAEISDIHIIAVTAHVLCLDILVHIVNLMHLFQTFEQLHSDVGNYGLKGLTRLHFLVDVLEDGEREVFHNQEATALNGCVVILVLREFSQLGGEVSQELALSEHVGRIWRQWIKLDRIILPRTLFLKDAHCALASESNYL